MAPPGCTWVVCLCKEHLGHLGVLRSKDRLGRGLHRVTLGQRLVVDVIVNSRILVLELLQMSWLGRYVMISLLQRLIVGHFFNDSFGYATCLGTV